MTGNGQTSDVKAALLARWQEGPIEGGGLAIPRASRTTRVPLSLAQQRLWILEQFQPGDHQVKLRGYRVELGEIETHLDGHPDVADAAVTLDETPRSGGRLVAHVVLAASAAGGEPDACRARLVAHLRGLLPGYMVPAAFVFHDSLPKNPSGKVDRRTLPAPGPQSASTAGFLAPRTPVEEQIARSAAEMLGVQRVGVRDDFFELGGHSLTAAQLVTALCVSFGIELAVQDMFVDPTVEHLAALVEAELRREAHLGDEDERMRSLVADMPDESVDALVRQLLTAPGLQAQTPC